MDLKSFGGLIGGIVVAILLATAVLIPIIDSTQATIGDEITKINESSNINRADYYDEDVTIVLTGVANASDNSGTTITINDIEFENPNVGYVPLCVSDEFLIFFNSKTNSRMGGLTYFNGSATTSVNLSASHEYTIVYSASDKTINMTNTDLSDSSTTDMLTDYPTGDSLFTWKTDGSYIQTSDFSNVFVKMDTIEDKTAGVFIIRQNIDIDGVSTPIEGIAYKGGEVIIPPTSGDYDISCNVNVTGLEIADGTTDIYTGGTPTFTISLTNTETSVVDTQTLTPTYSFVLEKATGHESGGTMYNLLGIIPILVIVGIFMGIIATIFIRRE